MRKPETAELGRPLNAVMDHYVLGTGRKFVWRDVLRTLEAAETAEATVTTEAGQAGR